MVDISEYFNILELTSHVAVQSGEGNRGLRFGLGDAWHVLAVFGSLEEFGERGVNHLLCSTQSKPSYTLTSFSVLMRPPWVSLFLYKPVSSLLLAYIVIFSEYC